MNPMWPLFADEVTRTVPRMARALDALAVNADDAVARASLTQEIAKLRSAMGVLGEPGMDALLRPFAEFNANSKVNSKVNSSANSAAQRRALIDLMASVEDVNRADLASTVTSPVAVKSKSAARSGVAETSLEALFAQEVEQQSVELTRHLLQLEAFPDRLEPIRSLLRAFHSIKGAARTVGVNEIVELTHLLEDKFTAIAKGNAAADSGFIELVLQGVDAMKARANDLANTDASALTGINAKLVAGTGEWSPVSDTVAGRGAAAPTSLSGALDDDPVLRVRASQISHVINLASSVSVEGQRLDGFAQTQLRLRRQLTGVRWHVDEILQRHAITLQSSGLGAELSSLRARLDRARFTLNLSVDDFSTFARGSQQLNARLLHAASGARLRPFGDLTASYPRLVRDLARKLGKQARLVIEGDRLDVDRDVLFALDMPLTHLLRNALDHGLEAPAVRSASGKSAEGQLRLAASFRGGLLVVELSDDGAGVDPEKVRKRLIETGQFDRESAALLDLNALHESLFVAGFSTREKVTETSGRGIGLDAVQQMVRDIDGTTRLESKFGSGTRFEIQVPISRVMLRALLIEVEGELCAFALTRVSRVVRAVARDLVVDGGIRYLPLDGKNIGLIGLAEQLEFGRTRYRETISVVVFENLGRAIGCVVERIVGEADLATQALDRRLGRVSDVASVALTSEGVGVIVLDVDDILRAAFDPRRRVLARSADEVLEVNHGKRVLVVDDSISVRELERQLLSAAGYQVEVAIDGEDAWQKLNHSDFELMVTDIDMPRLDGIALTRSVRQDARLRRLPVIIVSYRNTPQDHARGMEVRADRYLTKSDFDDERFLSAVIDLIGPASA